MASEIRVNTINNRSGLGTISITNSGAVFSGVTTFAQIKTTSGEVTVGTGASVYSPATNVLALGTNNAERVRITSSGDVGIGTDNPETPRGNKGLEIAGTTGAEFVATRFDDNIVDGDFIGGFVFKNLDLGGTPNHFAGMYAKANGTAGGMDLHFSCDRDRYENDNSDLIIRNSNIGIGTDNPTTKLHISSTGTPTIQITDEDNSGIVKIENGSGSLFLNADTGNSVSNSRIGFYIDGGEKARIDGNGRLSFTDSEGIVLSAKISSLYANNGSISYYGTNNGVYVNGAGPNGFLRLNAAGSENYRTCVDLYGSTATSADLIIFRTADNEAARFTDSGNLKFPSGQGIDFSANSNAAGMTSELLDDYEEGTWTPSFYRAGTTRTHSLQTGYYTKVGNKVTVTFEVELSSFSQGGSGQYSIQGLPFSSDSRGNYGGCLDVWGGVTLSSGYTNLGLMANGSSTIFILMQSSNNGGAPDTSGVTYATSNLIFRGQFNYWSGS